MLAVEGLCNGWQCWPQLLESQGYNISVTPWSHNYFDYYPLGIFTIGVLYPHTEIRPGKAEELTSKSNTHRLMQDRKNKKLRKFNTTNEHIISFKDKNRPKLNGKICPYSNWGDESRGSYIYRRQNEQIKNYNRSDKKFHSTMTFIWKV